MFGFIGGRSTSLHSLTVLDKWTKILDDWGTIHAVYILLKRLIRSPIVDLLLNFGHTELAKECVSGSKPFI